jgi:hypothetical protein
MKETKKRAFIKRYFDDKSQYLEFKGLEQISIKIIILSIKMIKAALLLYKSKLVGRMI